MLVCLTCWEVFDSDAMNRAIGMPLFCPKKSCCGQDVVDLDECMIPIIKVLNEKGYYTRFCCSGHSWANIPTSDFYADTHIVFDEPVTRKDLHNLPAGFVMKAGVGNVGVTIRKEYHIADTMELHIAILKTAIDLTKWAKGLAVLPEA
jgi:hypothetical protein